MLGMYVTQLLTIRSCNAATLSLIGRICQKTRWTSPDACGGGEGWRMVASYGRPVVLARGARSGKAGNVRLGPSLAVGRRPLRGNQAKLGMPILGRHFWKNTNGPLSEFRHTLFSVDLQPLCSLSGTVLPSQNDELPSKSCPERTARMKLLGNIALH